MHDHQSSVAILMATYNGERYITAQIRSIVDQSWPRWRLYIRDDGSQDGTAAIVSQFAEEFPDRISVFPSGGTRLGADGNFSYLLEHVESDYFMFCDQDDVWLPQKVEKSLQCMWALEANHGSAIPLLVHTDLRVVDTNLSELDSSVWHYGYHDPAFSQQLNRLLIQNMVFGCATLINARLKELATPIPDGVVQYDWWLALVSALFGSYRVYVQAHPLCIASMRERSGCRPMGTRLCLRMKACVFRSPRRWRVHWLRVRRQAALLLDRYAESLRLDRRQTIAVYVALERTRLPRESAKPYCSMASSRPGRSGT